MRIHLIAIGGSVMHNLALALQAAGHRVTGSDDEIYDPSRKRLAASGLLPESPGWQPDRIHAGLDVVILGMHARRDNPELLKARSLKLPVVSFPEFIYRQSENKNRVVVAGSHGKTTITSLLMHILRQAGIDYDYLVGAQLQGFERMVRLSDAPLIILEGDEYLSSPIDPQPKFLHYRPHLAVITGIAWDHMNVFPTFESYITAFEQFVSEIAPGGQLFLFGGDAHLRQIAKHRTDLSVEYYKAFPHRVEGRKTIITLPGGSTPTHLMGKHNAENVAAAWKLAIAMGVPEQGIAGALASFQGAARRLQPLKFATDRAIFLDFAHAPSKVAASTSAVKEQFPERRLVACVELHTYSSLNQAFLPQYRRALNAAEEAIVFFSPHTLQMKKLPELDADLIRRFFGHPALRVFTDPGALRQELLDRNWAGTNLLLMSSGRFQGLNIEEIVEEGFSKIQ